MAKEGEGPSSLDFSGVPDISTEQLDELFPEDEKKKKDENSGNDDVLLDDDGNVIEEPLPEDSTNDDLDDKSKEGDDDNSSTDDTYTPGDSLKGLNEKYNLGMNMDNLPEEFTVEEEVNTLSKLLDNRVEAFQNQLAELKNYDQLLEADPELKTYLKYRSEGKGLKELFADLGGTAVYANEDVQVAKYFKEEYGFGDEQIAEEIQKMKDAGVYDDRRKAIVDAAVAKEEKATADAVAAKQAEEKAAADAYEKQSLEYFQYLKEIKGFGEFKISESMKKDLFNHATKLDQEGYTTLERDVQSKENALKASLAIKYWPQIVKVLSTVANEKVKGDILENLFVDDPSKLQSSSTRRKSDDQFSADIANSF